MQQVVTNDGDCGGTEMQVLCGARAPVVPEPGSVVIAKVFERTDKQSSDQITSHQITSVNSIGSVTRQRQLWHYKEKGTAAEHGTTLGTAAATTAAGNMVFSG
jgi:hypothetical protein